jgi:hypothetical protein
VWEESLRMRRHRDALSYMLRDSRNSDSKGAPSGSVEYGRQRRWGEYKADNNDWITNISTPMRSTRQNKVSPTSDRPVKPPRVRYKSDLRADQQSAR